MKPAEAKRLAELAGCTGDSWKAKSIQQLWAGMGHIYELQCGDERIVAKVVKLPKRCDSVGDRRKAKSYECEAAFYRDGYAAQLLDAGVVVPRPLHVEARSDGVTIVMSRLDGRPGAFDRRGTEAALAALARLHACFWGPRADEAVAGGLQPQGTMSYLDTRKDEFDSMPTRGWEGRLRLAARAIDERLKADRMQSVVHGDPKDANFYFAADGTPQLYDFQYCGKACPAKDVAYCLCCGSSAWDDADDLARGYHRDLSAALASRGDEAPPLDAFLETLELAYADLGRWMSGWGWWGNDLEPRIRRLLDRLDGGAALAPSEYEVAIRREFPV